MIRITEMESCDINIGTIGDNYQYFINDEDLFQKLSQSMKKNNCNYIPIVDENNEIIYYAEEVKGIGYELNASLNSIETGKTYFTLHDLYPALQGVRINGFNEWSLRLLKILKRWNIDFEVQGEKWKTFFPEYAAYKFSLPENRVMNIYTDGTNSFPKWYMESFEKEWSFLLTIAAENYICVSEAFYKLFQQRGIKCYRVYFPVQYISKSLQEDYRRLAGISGIRVLGRLGKYADEQINELNGGTVTPDEVKEYEKAKEYEYLYIDGRAVKVKHWGTQEKYKLYMIGPCIVDGESTMKDCESLGACLYDNIRKQELPYTVDGYVVNSFEFCIFEKVLYSLTINDGDIVLLISNHASFVPCHSDIDLIEMIEKRTGDWFYNMPIHTNYTGNLEITSAIVNRYLKPIMTKYKKSKGIDKRVLQVGERRLNETEVSQINAYVKQIKKQYPIEGGEKGANVMNCNPMTKGHEWLISEASKIVNFLYVFIVEEDKSYISFQDRFAMVRSVCSKMKNVAIIPSGKFVLSAMTLPLYFEKSEKQYMTLDANVDLYIFGKYIANELGITKRFVGTEQSDLITRQYNEQMKILLPEMGVSVVELQRLQYGSIDISASLVRKAMREHDHEKLMHYVPEDVFQYLVSTKMI